MEILDDNSNNVLKAYKILPIENLNTGIETRIKHARGYLEYLEGDVSRCVHSVDQLMAFVANVNNGITKDTTTEAFQRKIESHCAKALRDA